MNDEMEQEPPLEPARFNLDRTYYIGLNAIKFDELKGIISTDLPSCFPINSKMTDGTTKKLVNSAYHQQKLPQLTAYLHACVGSIPLTTWMKSISKE